MTEEIGFDLLNAGIDTLNKGDANSAADIFENVLKQRVDKYGELGFECAECYLWYGKALLEVARAETDELLFAIKDTPQNDTQKSFSDSVSAILKTSIVSIDKNNNNDIEKKKESLEGEENDNSPNKSELNLENETNNAQTYDDAETFQIAWEWLDTARVILSRELESCKDEGKKAQIAFQFSDVLSSLGQLALETDNVEAALEDLLLCLTLRKDLLPTMDRILAETHFYVGMAYQLNSKLNEALNEFDKAKKILTTILEDDSISSGLQHIIKTTLIELDTKIIETQQTLTGVDNSTPEQVKEALSEILNNQPKPVQQPVTEIRNLGVFGCGKKRKRKDDNTDNSEEPPKKQSKTKEDMTLNNV